MHRVRRARWLLRGGAAGVAAASEPLCIARSGCQRPKFLDDTPTPPPTVHPPPDTSIPPVCRPHTLWSRLLQTRTSLPVQRPACLRYELPKHSSPQARGVSTAAAPASGHWARALTAPQMLKTRRKKNVKKGIQFCLMVCGASGTGRTTFVNTLCGKKVLQNKDSDDPNTAHIEEGVKIQPVTVGTPPPRPIAPA